jgi:hypothetical protein
MMKVLFWFLFIEIYWILECSFCSVWMGLLGKNSVSAFYTFYAFWLVLDSSLFANKDTQNLCLSPLLILQNLCLYYQIFIIFKFKSFFFDKIKFKSFKFQIKFNYIFSNKNICIFLKSNQGTWCNKKNIIIVLVFYFHTLIKLVRLFKNHPNLTWSWY